MVFLCVILLLLLFMAGKERELSDANKCDTSIEIIIFDYLFRYIFLKSIK